MLIKMRISSTYKKKIDIEHIYIRNLSTSKVMGTGKVTLKMTFE